jgi:hypothetical protein
MFGFLFRNAPVVVQGPFRDIVLLHLAYSLVTYIPILGSLHPRNGAGFERVSFLC